jgi:hypothetical protein
MVSVGRSEYPSKEIHSVGKECLNIGRKYDKRMFSRYLK